MERCVVQAKEGARERLQAVRGKIARVQQKFGGSSAAGSSKELRSGELRRRAPRPRSNNGIRRPASRHGSHSDGGHHPEAEVASAGASAAVGAFATDTALPPRNHPRARRARRGTAVAQTGLQCQWRWRQSSARDAT